jgi:hypothetical protein
LFFTLISHALPASHHRTGIIMPMTELRAMRV